MPTQISKSKKTLSSRFIAGDHEYLVHKSTVLFREFPVFDEHADQVGVLTVQSEEVDPRKAPKKAQYKVKIGFRATVATPPSILRISLYTIAIQGRCFPVTITRALGANVRFRMATDSTWNDELPLTLRPAAASAGGLADSKKIWFISFSVAEECVLYVESSRRIFKRPTRLGEKDGHDVTPPPGDSGGQDGSN
jgi:hypothetical protein